MPSTAHLGGAVTVLAASALVAAPPAQAVEQPARPTRGSERSTSHPASALAVPDLDSDVVARYGWYVRPAPDGHYVIRVPAALERADPLGLAAARAAVASTNFLIDAQGVEAGRRGERSRGGRVHATLGSEWWGLTFTLDAEAARVLADDIAAGRRGESMLARLRQAGVVVAPEALGVMRVILDAVVESRSEVTAKTTDDGLVVKCLWDLVPWFERPTGPFLASGAARSAGRPAASATNVPRSPSR